MKLTFAEAKEFVDEYNNRRKEMQKERANFDYNLAYLTGLAVHIKPPTSFPTLKQAYKGLFVEEKNDNDWILVKNSFINYAKAVNERWDKKG